MGNNERKLIRAYNLVRELVDEEEDFSLLELWEFLVEIIDFYREYCGYDEFDI